MSLRTAPRSVRAASTRTRDRAPSGSDRAARQPSGTAGPRPRPGRRGPTGPSEESGFTLVELLVVVIVLGTLTAIAVPTFTGQRESAWDAAVSAELRSASIALESYRAQNGVYSSDALVPGSGWGYEPSGNLDSPPDVITADDYCLIAQFVSPDANNTNHMWRVRDDRPVERIDTLTGDCDSPPLTTP